VFVKTNHQQRLAVFKRHLGCQETTSHSLL